MRHRENRSRLRIASERIDWLFMEADNAALKGEFGLADRYVANAIKISIRTNQPISSELKRKFCKQCHHYLLPAVTSRVRLNSREKRVEARCLYCGRKSYYPYINEVKQRRRVKAVGSPAGDDCTGDGRRKIDI